MIIALILVEGYVTISQKPQTAQAQVENVKGLLANIKFPSITSLLSFNILPANLSSKTWGGNPNSNSFNLPTGVAPTKAPGNTYEVGNGPSGSPTAGDSGQISLTPTNVPGQPAASIKPTKTPKPTATPVPPPVTSDVRPGTTLGAIFQDVGQRECIPAALLAAFQTEESGAWWSLGDSPAKVKIYNTYGWWINGTGDSCTGMGYDTQTGIVPQDAADAGTVCQNPIPSGEDQQIMGLLQISQFEQDAAAKYLKSQLPKNLDRRVIFDNAMIFAVITKNRLGTPPSDCNNWPDSAVSEAAQKHYGSCGDNYCSNVLKYYHQYQKSL